MSVPATSSHRRVISLWLARWGVGLFVHFAAPLVLSCAAGTLALAIEQRTFGRR